MPWRFSMRSNSLELAPMLTERFEEALLYAIRLHATQRRKASDVPFVAHLFSVTASVLEDGGSEDEAIAALLHDAVEDQGGPATRQAIVSRFGQTVADIIDGCTDTDEDPKPPWRERKERFLERLEGAPLAVLRVMAADKLENVRSLLRELERHGPGAWAHFRGGREGTIWYYTTATEILQRRFPASALMSELARQVGLLERH
jgi:(p)ppGpp synthase/HD superfamily hydrolase